jgi:hypothetical protein
MRHLLFALLMTAGVAHADVVSDLQAGYRTQGAGPADAGAGQTMWQQTFKGPSGDARSCASCHTSDLRKTGKHARTGKLIEPMAPSVNAARLTDPAKIEKWFTRNCKWTMGRACTVQEKTDFLSYIQSQ